MPVYRHRVTEENGRKIILSDLEEVRCLYCRDDAYPQICYKHGVVHPHGFVCAASNTLVAICNDCTARYRRDWAILENKLRKSKIALKGIHLAISIEA